MLIVWEKFYGLSNVGHYHTQIKAIHNLAPEAKLIVLCSKNVQKIDNFLSQKQVIPCLFEKTTIIKNPQFYAQKIQKSLDKLSVTWGAHSLEILVPSVDFSDLLTIIEMANDITFPKKFHLRIINPKDVRKLSSKHIKSLRTHISEKKIILLSETENLKIYLWKNLRLNVAHSFHLPCIIQPEHPLTKMNKKTGKVKVLFLGGLRGEKGYYKLPKILRAFYHIIKDTKEHSCIEFLFEKNTQKPKRFLNTLFSIKRKYTEIQFAKIKKEIDEKKVKITRFQSGLEDREYIKLINDADIILLPYKLKSYENRGSGVVADGVLAGKIFIYTQGIGMESFLNYGNGLPSTNHLSFASNLKKSIEDIESLNQKTQTARNDYLESLRKTSQYINNLI